MNENQQTTYTLDWLQYTCETWAKAQHALKTMADIAPLTDKAHNGKPRAARGYNSAIIWSEARLDWHTIHTRNMYQVTHSGAMLREAQRKGISLPDLIDIALAFSHNVNRVDFAIDIQGNTEVSPIDIYELFVRGICKTHAKNHRLIVGNELNTRTGTTMYIGSRQSTTMLRVYDKAAEQDEPGPWVRIEIEVHSPLARNLLKGMQMNGIVKMGKAEVRRYIETGCPWFDEAAAGDGGELREPVGRKETDWLSWVHGTALPAVLRAIEIGDETTIAAVQLGLFPGLK